MEILKAIHVNWTKPFFHKNDLRGHAFNTIKAKEEYELLDYQYLYTILSILNWKRLYGYIKLYTDKVGEEYYKKIGILDLYDEVDTEFLDGIKCDDPAQFWTSGKIHAICNEIPPFVFLDNDFILYEKIDTLIQQNEMIISNWEIGRGKYYFTENEFNSTINHYKLPEDYSIKSLVPNTSFLFFKNDKVLSEYKTIHIECINTVDVYPEWFWLYTDQCSLGYLIRKHKIKVDTLSDFIFLMDSDFAYKNEDVELGYTQPYYLQMNREIRNIFYNHIWLRKVQYNDDPQLKFEDCKNWISELNLNFPQYSYLVNNIKFN